MPRKRQTKINKRGDPKCPEGEEGKSLTEDECREKLDVFIKDFDIKYEETLKKMDDNKTKMMKGLENRLHCQLMQLPACIRKMKLKDFIELGGTVEAALAPTKSMEPPSSSLPISGKLAQRISKLNPKILCEAIPEEEEATPCVDKKTVKKTSTRQTVRKSTRKRKTRVDSYMAPPSISRVKMTPASRNMSSAGWPTPLITPKFNPGLPFTPGMDRDPKPGERILSLAGSPINNPVDTKKRPGRARTQTIVSKEDLEDIHEVIPSNPKDIKNMRQSQMFRVISFVSNILKQSDEDEVY